MPRHRFRTVEFKRQAPKSFWVARRFTDRPSATTFRASSSASESETYKADALGDDARLALTALKVAIATVSTTGMHHHSDRGSQYASGIYQELLAAHDLVGLMSRRENPYDTVKAESAMKTLKVRRSIRWRSTRGTQKCDAQPLLGDRLKWRRPLWL